MLLDSFELLRIVKSAFQAYSDQPLLRQMQSSSFAEAMDFLQKTSYLEHRIAIAIHAQEVVCTHESATEIEISPPGWSMTYHELSILLSAAQAEINSTIHTRELHNIKTQSKDLTL